ncbi:vitamin K epoxide reductase family protein [Candidatus Gracilibacteria bacterium]|nr:vitamin K epoxide reductase family protein [Candidatus Gracilibacteria bacterium]
MKKLYAIFALAIVAMGNAIYLTISAFNYASGDKSSLFCDINNTFSCSTLFSYDFATIFGLPFPAIAMIVYPILAILAIVGAIYKLKGLFKVILTISIMGIMFNSYIIYNEFQVMVFCPACLFCTVIIITIAIMSYIGNKEEKRLK